MPREYHCDREGCDKVFPRKGDLRRHILGVHDNARAYRCKKCPKAFNQRSGLQTHENTHTGNKPHKCPAEGCGRGFGDPSSCTRHFRETHGNYALYACPIEGCTSRIKRRATFRNHVKTHGVILTGPEIEKCNINREERFSASASPVAGPSTLPPIQTPLPPPPPLFFTPVPPPPCHGIYDGSFHTHDNTSAFASGFSTSAAYANHLPQTHENVPYDHSAPYLEQPLPNNNMYSTSSSRSSSQPPELVYSSSSSSNASSPPACLTPEPLIPQQVDTMRLFEAEDSMKSFMEALASGSWPDSGPSEPYNHSYDFFGHGLGDNGAPRQA
ncbi:hypothetical protein VNI00_001157 [Paramarasmius palmivorus]|uniref:C2H2-type domain-containing protein n=1 Tax=Paramarasmius palmivorus TaxID=297713 RepID=A0AAW0E8M9_9AGAR